MNSVLLVLNWPLSIPEDFDYVAELSSECRVGVDKQESVGSSQSVNRTVRLMIKPTRIRHITFMVTVYSDCLEAGGDV